METKHEEKGWVKSVAYLNVFKWPKYLPMEVFGRPARMAFAFIWILYFIYVFDIRSILHKTESQLYTSKSLSWKILKNLVGRMAYAYTEIPFCFNTSLLPPCIWYNGEFRFANWWFQVIFLNTFIVSFAAKKIGLCLRSINRFHWGHRPWQVYCPSSPPDATNQKEWSKAHRFGASFPITVFLVERTRRDLS